MQRILLLGGTSEAGALAAALAARGDAAVYSYAGRTGTPKAQPLPTRIGGFGGVQGLIAYLRQEAITHVIDATHPFAATMSANAVAACAVAGVALGAFERPPWCAQPRDRWMHVPDVAAACRGLPDRPARIFLAIGRQHLAAFSVRSEHVYLLRLVDPPDEKLPLPHTHVVVARGPFTCEADMDLLRAHRIELVVTRNAGGKGAWSKLAAARALGLPVIMIDRPDLPPRPTWATVREVLDWLDHDSPADLGE
ncbi:MAG: cobalt-precorrin-6A reductase [Hyphomicrobiaceae bacterium]